jgi:MFS family permease
MTPERIYQFWILFGGQCMLGIALPFVGLNVVTVLATNWFSENERTIGGTIAMLANILGPAVAFGVCPAIVKTGTDIQTLLLAEAIAITVVCPYHMWRAARNFLPNCFISAFLVIIAFRAKPPTPPSSAAVVEDKHDTAEKKLSFIGGVKIFFVDLFACFKELHFVILLVGYGLGFGAIQSLMTLINQISIPEGYDTDQAGLFGVALVVASIFGALIAGGILDKTRRYVMVLRIVLVGALGCAAWLTFDLRPNRFPVLMACCALLGFA